MNINFINRCIQNSFVENFPIVLTAQQKKVAAIAVSIFSCLALTYYFYRFCNFKAASLDTEDLNTDNSVREDLEVMIKSSSTYIVKHLEDGRFKKVFDDGMIEIGKFKNKKLEGEGIRLLPSKLLEESDELEEEVEQGIRRQKGMFKNGVLEGKGQVLFFDGQVDEGEFSNSLLIEGIKRYSNVTSSLIDYESGTFVDDKLTGQGEIHFKNGKVQKGTFQAGHLRMAQLFIKSLKGQTNTLSISLDGTVTDLMEQVAKKVGTPIDQQRLIFQGKQLEKGRPLADYKIEEGDSIQLLLRLGGD